MRVIPFPNRPRDEATPRVVGRQEAPIHGTFRSPSGRAGTMSGRLLLDRFEVVAEQLRAEGVFIGELRDADGSLVGVESRRRSAPATVTPDADGYTALIGPMDLDLLGLTVSIPAFRLDARSPGRPSAVGPEAVQRQAGSRGKPRRARR